MIKNIHKYLYFKIFLIFIITPKVNCQVLENSETIERIKEGVDNIYNLEFDKAESVYNYIKSNYPDHSVPYLFKSLMIYWKNFPLIPGNEPGKQFEENLKKAIKLSEEELDKNRYEAENLLSGLGSNGLLMLYFADNGLSRNVISLAPGTYKLLMKSFDYTRKYSDFYFITGLYNYYREAYPEVHPVYKPILMFFPSGNKKLGIKQLKIAADSAIFLKAESNSFLSGIYQSFERDPKKALIYSKKLYTQYPNNIYFKTAYIKDLLLAKKYFEAEKIIDNMGYPGDNKYFQAQIDIFRGIIEEKKYNNNAKASQFYRQGIRKAELYNEYGNEYAAYGYFGLSRVNSDTDDKKTIKQYRKHARELAVFEDINFDN